MVPDFKAHLLTKEATALGRSPVRTKLPLDVFLPENGDLVVSRKRAFSSGCLVFSHDNQPRCGPLEFRL